MNKPSIILILSLMLIIFISGCIYTGNIPRDEIEPNETQLTPNETNITETEPDPCEGIICGDTIKICSDGFEATCENACINGSCPSCKPDCSDHDFIYIDLCQGITCPDSSTTCPDGFTATCPNTCNLNTGECPSCTPDCSGHELTDPCEGVTCQDSALICQDNFTATCQNTCNPETGECSLCIPDCTGHEAEECQEDWTCTEWSSCENETKTRTCTDQNECGTEQNKPEELEDCEVVGVDHIIFTEIYYDTIGTDSNEEWIELYNPTAEAINLTGWILRDNNRDWIVPESTIIEPKSYITIARNATGFFNLYGCNPSIEGLTLPLSNLGDMLSLEMDSEQIDFVAWEEEVEGWNIEASTDKTIRRASLDLDTDTPDDWLSEQEPDPFCI